ncbi:MAG: sodium:glutamate symporter [Clostridia bacterium]|nr:sodium:glutamate symporter [Clostridia bacterium]
MDFSSANTALWSPIVQIGVIAGLILLANILLRKIRLVRDSLMPIAVMAGFILLLLRSLGLVPIDTAFLETVTYHALALGFIALALRVPDPQSSSGALTGFKSGALIVSTYLVQAIVGLLIAFFVAYTFMPDFFKASGVLLAMAYGQGPGQANNVGSTYEALGMAGGRSFGLSLAAAGYLCACIVGVIYMNILNRKKKIVRVRDKEQISGSVTVDVFQDKNEIPIAESIDKLSVQAALICVIYLLTYLLTAGITALLEAVSPGVANTVGTLLWGFNFIIGSMLAMGCRMLFKGLQKTKLMSRQYQNNYLLSRLSGLAFDVMIVAGIASIDISDISGYWVPFLLMAVIGGVVTFYYLLYLCKKLYPGYEYEGFFSMFGMLTGTLSSGVLLLREIDPELKTPASNNLIAGSSFGIALGAPVLLLVSFAAQDDLSAWLTLLLAGAYLAVLLFLMLKVGKKKK